MISMLVIWAAISSLVFSAILTPSLCRSEKVPKWLRWIFLFLLGPSVWVVIIAALLIAAVMFCIYSNKQRRAKTKKSGA